MKYSEKNKDIFTLKDDYTIAYFVGADFALGKGIGAEINKRYDMCKILRKAYPTYFSNWEDEIRKDSNTVVGDCLYSNGFLHIIVKSWFWRKATTESIKKAIVRLKEVCEKEKITKIAFQGDDVDTITWAEIAEMIKETFENTDITIVVCK